MFLLSYFARCYDTRTEYGKLRIKRACVRAHGYQLLPLPPHSKIPRAGRAKPTCRSRKTPPRAPSIQVARAWAGLSQPAAVERGVRRDHPATIILEARAVFLAWKAKAPLPFLASLLPCRPVPARLGLCCGRAGGHMRNLLPVVKETCYFGQRRSMCFTPRPVLCNPQTAGEGNEDAQGCPGSSELPSSRLTAGREPSGSIPARAQPRCSRWGSRRRPRAAWELERGWAAVVVSHGRLCSVAGCSHPLHKRSQVMQRAGKRKDEAGNISGAGGTLLAPQMAGATRLGICPGKTHAWGARAAALPASVP